MEVLDEFKKINIKYNFNLKSYLKINILIFYNYFLFVLKKILPKTVIQNITILKNKLLN